MKRVIGGLVLVGSLILIGGVIVRPDILNIKDIECYTQFGECAPDLEERVTYLLGEPIYSPLPRQKIRDSFSDLAGVSEVQVYRRLPSTVVLGVQVRRPVAVVLGASNERVVTDEEGLVFAPVDKSALPVLVTEDQVLEGTYLSDQQLEASILLNKIASVVAEPVTGKVSDDILTVTTQKGTQILLSTSGQVEGWETTLQSIWARSKIDGKFMRKIDLRFSRPAVSY